MSDFSAQPSASDQLLFLSRVQRLVDSGKFTATYKFALFLALAELAVERGDDSGHSLRLPLDAVADRFLSLYWRQAAPYAAHGVAAVLQQNTGQQAAIITRIAEAHQTLGISLGAARTNPAWRELVGNARQIIISMPLLRLQTIGREVATHAGECFLYDNVVPEHELTLYPGVAFCLRRFFPLLQGMVRAKWLGWVQAQNGDVLGAIQDLESFMFGATRSNARAITEALLELQNGCCFYQRNTTLSVATAHVDHFIPWAKYPCDAIENFVLASTSANSKKKDHLPATEYLGRWSDRNKTHQKMLASTARFAGIESGDGAIQRVAAWAYGSHEMMNGLVWHASAGLIELDPGWRKILGV